MRFIKLTGREASVVRAIGYADRVLGSEIVESTRMAPEDITDTLNSLMSAGFVESDPYFEQLEGADMPATTFEVNPAYAHEMRGALQRR
jgi:hypothetical protein